jgi:DNA-binding HxlR family transcriptional regulator
MTDHGSYCPVNLATEVLADRWTPLIVREMLLGTTRFNDLVRALPGISRSLLTQRLRHLERHGVLEAWPSPTGRGSEYHLTPAGKDLDRVIDVLARWAIEWLYDDLQAEEIPPTQLMWWMHRRVDAGRFPPVRTVLEFRFTRPQETIWLLLERDTASVCVQHPGGDPDVVVTATARTLSQVFQGGRRWPEAVANGDIDVAGTPRLVRALPTWFTWSPWADVAAERAGRPPGPSRVASGAAALATRG